MRIKQKLILLPVAVFLLITGMVSVAWLGLDSITSLNQRTQQYEQQAMYLQMILRGANESILTDGTADSIRLARTGIEKFEENYYQKAPWLRSGP